MDFLKLRFEQLTPHQLYRILKLRFDVFVMEQNSIYDEYDNIDFISLHMFAEAVDYIPAYLRIYKKSDSKASLGRIVVHPAHRGTGLGREIVTAGIEYIETSYQGLKIEIGAQLYLKSFYESFGFVQSSDIYDDGGINHIMMIRESKKTDKS